MSSWPAQGILRIYFGFFIFSCNRTSSNLNALAVPLLLHIVPATTEAFILSWDMLFMRVHKITKTDYWLRHVCPSLCLSSWHNPALKSDKNNEYITRRPMCIYDISLDLHRMMHVSDKSYTENPNTHFMFNNFFRQSCG
jgi:hypothetical protein